MRLIINLILVAIIAVLGYLVVGSIKEPIQFNAEKDKRQDAVVQRLMNIRLAQKMYRGIVGEFAPTFDTLSEVLSNGRFEIIGVTGDKDDPQGNTDIIYDTIYVSARDSVKNVFTMSVDSLKYLPYGNGKTFEMSADTITYQQTLVPVVEVRSQYKDFMGKYAESRFSKYNKMYDPNNYLKFGDMRKPNLSGNWER